MAYTIAQQPSDNVLDVARYGGLEDLNQTDEELFSYLAPHPDLLEKQAVAEKLFQVRLPR